MTWELCTCVRKALSRQCGPLLDTLFDAKAVDVGARSKRSRRAVLTRDAALCHTGAIQTTSHASTRVFDLLQACARQE